jgi:uncharacterized membrane protein SpoIIM required for sporulation
VTLALGAGAALGASQAARYPLPPELVALNSLDADFVDRLARLDLFSPRGAALIFFINLRAVAIATALGIFSFGAVAIVALMAPLALVGYFAATVGAAGINPWLFLSAFILPHGILEIPAAILAGGAILRLGASVVAPPPNRSLGEAWLAALADWLKIILGVVAPLLALAALLEVFVTPRVVLAVFGG